MSTTTSIIELRRMTAPELRKELSIKRAECAKMRMGIEMQSEKNSGLYRTLRKEIARMSMVLHELEKMPAAPKKAEAAAPVVADVPKKKAKSPAKASQAAKKSVKGVGSRSKKS